MLEGIGGLKEFQIIVRLGGRVDEIYLACDVCSFHATITL